MITSEARYSDKELESDLSVALMTAHARLLERFAQSAPNEMRGEIRKFRDVISRLATWSRRSDDLAGLAHRLRWVERYWYKREYSESAFVSFQANDGNSDSDRTFRSRYVDLLAPLITDDEIANATFAAATTGDTERTERVTAADEIGRTLREARPSVRHYLVGEIARVASQRSPDAYSFGFLSLIHELAPAITVAVLEHPVRIVAEIYGRRAEALLQSPAEAYLWSFGEVVHQANSAAVANEMGSGLDALLKDLLLVA